MSKKTMLTDISFKKYWIGIIYVLSGNQKMWVYLPIVMSNFRRNLPVCK